MAIFVLRKLCCVRRTKIKNLKAIHNQSTAAAMHSKLCSKNKDKKSESNSQQHLLLTLIQLSCVRRTKIKNLKAIHNVVVIQLFQSLLCSKNKDKKSESNSQQSRLEWRTKSRCVRRTKIKNLKAIHNIVMNYHLSIRVVFEEQR